MVDYFESMGRKLKHWFGLDAHVTSQPARDRDRRQWIRFPTLAETFYQEVRENEESISHPTKIENVSQGGIRLMTDEPCAVGRLLHVQLPQAGRENDSSLLACVVQVSRLMDDAWSMGCSFIRELTRDELQAFLRS